MSESLSFEDQVTNTRFSVEEPKRIYELVSENYAPLHLAFMVLEEPLDTIQVVAECDDSSFDTRSFIQYCPDSELTEEDTSKEVMSQLLETLVGDGEAQYKRGYYSFQGERGTDFLIRQFADGLYISTGQAKPENNISVASRLFKAPDFNQTTFSNALYDHSDALEKTTQVLYQAAGHPLPSQEIFLQPPRLRTNNALARAALNDSDVAGDLTEQLEMSTTGVSFEDIAGHSETMDDFKKLASDLEHPEHLRKWGAPFPKGVLLSGPPGTGKTLLAKALANEADARFLNVAASDINAKYFGVAEQKVKNIFEHAVRGDKKTVLCFDEVDSMGSARNDGSPISNRVLNTILANINGMQSNDNIIVLAMTNRPESLDPAMLRPGRMDMHIEVGLPDEANRIEIFDLHMKKTCGRAGRDIYEDVDTQALAKKTHDYSGADIAEIIRRTSTKKAHQEASGASIGRITTNDILAEIEEYEHKRNASKQMGFPVA